MLNLVRVGVAVPKVKVADCSSNIEEIINLIYQAEEQGVNVLVFPELCITGYTCADLFFQSTLISGAEKSLGMLLEATKDIDMVIATGLPISAKNQLFNCAAISHLGKIMGIIPKTYLPNSEEFYEKRWFSPAYDMPWKTIELCGQTVPMGYDILFNCNNGGPIIGVEICQDLWEPIPPSSYQALAGANLILNLSASSEIFAKQNTRRAIVTGQSSRTICAYAYCASGIGESTTDMVFSGHSLICENGSVLRESSRFNKDPYILIADLDFELIRKERQKNNGFMACSQNGGRKDFRFVDIPLTLSDPAELLRPNPQNPFLPDDPEEKSKCCEDMFHIQYIGLARRLEHTDIKKSVIAISGGLDSTLALLTVVKSHDFLGLPRENIIGITMPGFGTTGRTYNNAKELALSLGITLREISIKDACIEHFKNIGHDINTHDATFENAQARERTQIAMDIANMENAIVVGTGDLSELALGFTTYNGDHMSMYNVNCGIPKTLVRIIVTWLSSSEYFSGNTSKILLDIVDTPVSPELLPPSENGNPVQITEEIMGPYEINDFFLYYMLNYGFCPKKILFLAERAFGDKYSKLQYLSMLKNFYVRFFTQQFKRSCSPDGPKAVEIGLSPRGDWRMPSDASYSLWIQQLEDIKMSQEFTKFYNI